MYYKKIWKLAQELKQVTTVCNFKSFTSLPKMLKKVIYQIINLKFEIKESSLFYYLCSLV